MNNNDAIIRTAQQGLHLIEDALLRLLTRNPQGLRNVEIADMLNLNSEFHGQRRNYLTWSILGNLYTEGKVTQDRSTKLWHIVETPSN